jgi:hypothetical protein
MMLLPQAQVLVLVQIFRLFTVTATHSEDMRISPRQLNVATRVANTSLGRK